MTGTSTTTATGHDPTSRTRIANPVKQIRQDSSSIGLAEWPTIYLLPQGLSPEDYRDAITRLKTANAKITQTINHARLILSYASGLARVRHDLVSERLKDVDKLEPFTDRQADPLFLVEEPRNRAKEHQTLNDGLGSFVKPSITTSAIHPVRTNSDSIQILDPANLTVVRLQWIYDSIAEGNLLSVASYILLSSLRQLRVSSTLLQDQTESAKRKLDSIAERVSSRQGGQSHFRQVSNTERAKKRVLLSQETTEEYDLADERPLPEWVRRQIKYSCQRKQSQPSANEDFLKELRLIKRKRLLDEVHNEKIRNSYGKAIASIAAYPYPIRNASEVERLPRCGEKFGKLFHQFSETGSLQEAEDMRHDTRLQTLDLFWNIHGVGSQTAQELYNKGFRTIDSLRYKVWPQLAELFEDDPVEANRIEHLEDPNLDREQQQGLKFYYDFLEPIPRGEVEQIAAIVEEHLKAITDNRAQVMLVGSYRKGKPTSGDVDIVVSHPELSQTANLVELLYDSLDAEGWIRAKLKISLAHTHRDQKPVLKSHKSGSTFAALDIALLVWQDKTWPSKKQDLLEDPDARNPATCRRVDIIVSPWKSVGCAVLGWSGGITFERDLREYVNKAMGLKFDTSGVMDRLTGNWLDIEKYDDPATRAKTIAEAERRVIEGLGLECFDPTERLTD